MVFGGHAHDNAPRERRTDCEEALTRSQIHFLASEVPLLRETVTEEIKQLPPNPEVDFWLKTLLILKREQAGFSSVYMLPRGGGRLTTDEKIKVFAAYPKDRFNQPALEDEWAQFYWNHLQGRIRFVARKLKEALVHSVDPELPVKAIKAFDAVTMPTQIEDCTVDGPRVLQEIERITIENLRSSQTARRVERLPSLGLKPCCKAEGGCYDCFVNRRYLKTGPE
jgi:hypothetical protein